MSQSFSDQLLVARVNTLKDRIDLLLDLGVFSKEYSKGFKPVNISDYSDYNLPLDAKLILEIIGIGELAHSDVFDLEIRCYWDYEAEEQWEEGGAGDICYYMDFCSQFPKIPNQNKIIYLGCTISDQGFGYVINDKKTVFVTSTDEFPTEYKSFLEYLEDHLNKALWEFVENSN